MFAKYRYALLLCILFSCQNEFFPKGLYDYQVERLLSGGESKIWNQVVSSQDCQDSVRLFIELIPSNADDSVRISEIIRGFSCNPDTSVVGNADASSFADAILFTDSLNFSSGEFWIVQSITSNQLTIIKRLESVNLTSN